MKRPRVLIEEWLPAAAIGVECMRERGSSSALAPHTYLHIWWARRPLTASRAAVLGSVLPATFPRDVFEKLLGFGRPGAELVQARAWMDSGYQVPGGFNCDRAFKRGLVGEHLELAHSAAEKIWGEKPRVIDPMAGGGSIPLECARLGFETLINEYNPVACSVLEATVDYPLRFGERLAVKARYWARVWEKRVTEKLARFYPEHKLARVQAYIFARTIPCPDTKHHTPLVPDWHLLNPNTGTRLVAKPRVDTKRGTWTVDIVTIGRGAGQINQAPPPTYSKGRGVSLFTNQQIDPDWIKAKAQHGQMRSELYAVALKTNQGLLFQSPSAEDREAIAASGKELERLRSNWERTNVIPTEEITLLSNYDRGHRLYGISKWADMFADRQLLCFGVLVEELQALRREVVKQEGVELGEAIIHLLAFAVDKFANWNSCAASWNAPYATLRSVFDRHGYSFKPTWAEMAPCNAGTGLEWATDNVLSAYEEIAKLCRDQAGTSIEVNLGSATNLPQIADASVTAVVVDPPYADNVQYGELADFFYVWLKRTQGHRRPEWFSTSLCDRDLEAVVNLRRFRESNKKSSKKSRELAHRCYERLTTSAFAECHRILRDDGVLTVMFTHKKQEAWVSLFTSLIQSGFSITATWPVKTEGEHSLHQARKNAAQSTVILVARKRGRRAGTGYFGPELRSEIRERARSAAERLKSEGLNAIDQLVGCFGPAMEVYSRYDEVRLDTGEPVGVDRAIEEASDAVSQWRIDQLAERGLDGVEPEGRFALLCWDVMGATEFRFNEAKLLGHAAGMDVDRLIVAGLVSKEGDKIFMLSAKDRRREEALKREEIVVDLFGEVPQKKRRSKAEVLQIHPNDPTFRTTIDACHALALRHLEAGGGNAGIGSARALVRQQGWTTESSVARLMEALTKAAPKALRKEGGKNSPAAQFPEFRAWHALLEPLFGITPPDWTEAIALPPRPLLADQEAELDVAEAELEEHEDVEEDEEE